ncbi:MAG: hypothetical protein NEA02_18850, partial [Thermoanaerobaculia bacterium]|nr:hypothetical protein [Thermoanaerobaculia bacterium]
GLLKLSVNGCDSGFIDVTIRLPAAPPAGSVYYKYGPTAADLTPHWYPFPAQISGDTVTFRITDGGFGDDDLTRNGAISDPGGVAIQTGPAPFFTSRLVPIVLDVDNGNAHYSSELVVTNNGTNPQDPPLRATLLYTPSLGSGGGSVNESFPRGPAVIPDVIGWLRDKGLPIPTSGAQAGTLLVTFDGLRDPAGAAVTARTAALTAAPQPEGRAGLAYAGIDPAHGATGSMTVLGLRSTAADRSNLAVFNTSGSPITLKIAVFSGTGDGRSAVVAAAETLPPHGWRQFDRVLDAVGFSDGWAVIERVSTSGSFGAYGVVNDNVTNDGSFIPADPPVARDSLRIPVLVETPTFQSELVLTNTSPQPAMLALTYVESLATAATPGLQVFLLLPGRTQQIIPDAIDFLRSSGASIGPRGAASYAGSLLIEASATSASGLHAAARTAALSPAGGQFGLFTPAVAADEEAVQDAWVYGLVSDDSRRSNVAVVHAGQPGSGPLELTLQVFVEQGPLGPPATVLLDPGGWRQFNDFLRTKGVAGSGFVHVTRTRGTASWIAYGVVNDGAGPGQRTGDGAYVPMERR